MEIVVPERPKVFSRLGMVESKSAGTVSSLYKQDVQRGLLVDRGVGSSRLVKSASASSFTNTPGQDSETKVLHVTYYVVVLCDKQDLSKSLVICSLLFITRVQCQRLLVLLQLQLWPIRCWDQRKTDIWLLYW